MIVIIFILISPNIGNFRGLAHPEVKQINAEEFSLGHHEGDFEYESEVEAYHDRVEYLIKYEDGCVLWFYFDLESHTTEGWQWIKQVGHGLWG